MAELFLFHVVITFLYISTEILMAFCFYLTRMVIMKAASLFQVLLSPITVVTFRVGHNLQEAQNALKSCVVLY